MTKWINLVAIMTVAAPIYAQGGTLPKAVADLGCLVGNWRGGGTVALGKDKVKVGADWNCQRTASEFGVLCALRVTGIPGVSSYAETDLFGFEPNTNQYHWYAVTNAGETHDHVASLTEGNRIQFVYIGTQGGKALKEVIELNFAPDHKSVTGRAETFVGRAKTSVMELNLHQ